jgi:4-hydroxybenzoate polyprenyltransferase
MLKKVADFFLFSSLYIALCAVLMVYQSASLFFNHAVSSSFYFFVFFSTICSYNFHWYLSAQTPQVSIRHNWTLENKPLHLVLYLLGLAGAVYYGYQLREHWPWLGIGVLVTFLYSAPKIPQKIFIGLRKIAVGKTIFLAFVWTYVTTLLPQLISDKSASASFYLFAAGRFFFIYSICILFDCRDREDDKANGIKSMITWFNEKGIAILFAISILLFIISTFLLLYYHFSVFQVVILLIPGIAVAGIYRLAKRNFSDYLYYFVLDGLMMLSAVLMLVLHI